MSRTGRTPSGPDSEFGARAAARAGRERRVVDGLKGGVSMAEIARREGISERGMRKYVRNLMARKAPETTGEYVATQAARLNEALLLSFDAMASGRLGAVDRVLRIVRELDRYHGLGGDAPGTETRRKLLDELVSGADLADQPLDLGEVAPATRSPPAATARGTETVLNPLTSLVSGAEAADDGPDGFAPAPRAHRRASAGETPVERLADPGGPASALWTPLPASALGTEGLLNALISLVSGADSEDQPLAGSVGLAAAPPPSARTTAPGTESLLNALISLVSGADSEDQTPAVGVAAPPPSARTTAQGTETLPNTLKSLVSGAIPPIVPLPGQGAVAPVMAAHEAETLLDALFGLVAGAELEDAAPAAGPGGGAAPASLVRAAAPGTETLSNTLIRRLSGAAPAPIVGGGARKEAGP